MDILDRDDTPDGTAARPCHPERAVYGVSARAVGEAAAAPPELEPHQLQASRVHRNQ